MSTKRDITTIYVGETPVDVSYDGNDTVGDIVKRATKLLDVKAVPADYVYMEADVGDLVEFLDNAVEQGKDGTRIFAERMPDGTFTKWKYVVKKVNL